MISIFFASVVGFFIAYGKCREIMLEANKNALTHTTRYNDTITIYLDGRPYFDDASFHSSGKGMDRESVLLPWSNRRRVS